LNVFTYTDYRQALRDLVTERKQFERGFGFHALADAARIQRPYLSKVLKGTAQLSTDQMFLITTMLKLSAEEQDFLQLLLEHDRTAVAERKKRLAARIKAVGDKHRDSSAHLSAKTVDAQGSSLGGIADYYLDPITQVVHTAISIDHFAKSPLTLAAELAISGQQLHAILATLERLGLAYREGGKILPRETALHLAKSSPLYRAWRNQIKLLSSQRLNQLREEDAYSFTTVFSADEKTRKTVHERFLDFLKACETSVRDAPAKQVYHLAFDLFPWTGTR
jgi:uncharacterized protein (TIGR02147 family)